MYRPIVHLTVGGLTSSPPPPMTRISQPWEGLAPLPWLMGMKTSKYSISTFPLARIPASLTSGCPPNDLPSCAPRGEVPSSDRRLSLNTHIRLRQ